MTLIPAECLSQGRITLGDNSDGGRGTQLTCNIKGQGIVHKEFVPPGQTVNPTFYREVLERPRKRMARV
jgi:hypothetical protein